MPANYPWNMSFRRGTYNYCRNRSEMSGKIAIVRGWRGRNVRDPSSQSCHDLSAEAAMRSDALGQRERAGLRWLPREADRVASKPIDAQLIPNVVEVGDVPLVREGERLSGRNVLSTVAGWPFTVADH